MTSSLETCCRHGIPHSWGTSTRRPELPNTRTETLIVGIVTVSDQASQVGHEDRGGPV